jgi:hypothetical protein
MAESTRNGATDQTKELDTPCPTGAPLLFPPATAPVINM